MFLGKEHFLQSVGAVHCKALVYLGHENRLEPVVLLAAFFEQGNWTFMPWFCLFPGHVNGISRGKHPSQLWQILTWGDLINTPPP